MRSYHNRERGLTVATVAVTCLPCSSLSFSLPSTLSLSVSVSLSPFRFPFLNCLVNESCDFTTIQNWVDASTFLVSFSPVFPARFSLSSFLHLLTVIYCRFVVGCRHSGAKRNTAGRRMQEVCLHRLPIFCNVFLISG